MTSEYPMTPGNLEIKDNQGKDAIMATAAKAEAFIIKLDAYIDEEDQLVLSFKEPGLDPVVLRPERGLADLIADHEDRDSLTVEVRDFVQRGTVYKVYCATLEDDGHTVAAHWMSTAAGQMYEFDRTSLDDASRIKLFIGAIPQRKDAPVPMPLGARSASTCDPFPQDIEPPPQGGNG
jgi:hypothetical protein